MIIDCDTCVMRHVSCGDCVITALLGDTPGEIELDSTEENALGALAGVGLLPPLRLVPAYGPIRRRGAGAQGFPPATPADERAV